MANKWQSVQYLAQVSSWLEEFECNDRTINVMKKYGMTISCPADSEDDWQSVIENLNEIAIEWPDIESICIDHINTIECIKNRCQQSS